MKYVYVLVEIGSEPGSRYTDTYVLGCFDKYKLAEEFKSNLENSEESETYPDIVTYDIMEMPINPTKSEDK